MNDDDMISDADLDALLATASTKLDNALTNVLNPDAGLAEIIQNKTLPASTAPADSVQPPITTREARPNQAAGTLSPSEPPAGLNGLINATRARLGNLAKLLNGTNKRRISHADQQLASLNEALDQRTIGLSAARELIDSVRTDVRDCLEDLARNGHITKWRNALLFVIPFVVLFGGVISSSLLYDKSTFAYYAMSIASGFVSVLCVTYGYFHARRPIKGITAIGVSLDGIETQVARLFDDAGDHTTIPTGRS